MTKNYSDLIGKPFGRMGRGPDAYDCWGLVMEMLRRDGIQPKDYGWADEAVARQAMMQGAIQTHWERLNGPSPGAVALFRIGRFCSHVGYIIEGNKFIHAWEKTGVTTEWLGMDWQKRLEGCYKYVG